MSVQARQGRLSVTHIQGRKGGDKLVCLTAYTAPVARLLDPEVDVLLVGDSLAMTVYGFDSTLPVTLDMMIAHGAAVVRATEHALVTVDLPFGSYQASPEEAFRAAARVLAETGCAAVKLEGGEEMAETVRFLGRRRPGIRRRGARRQLPGARAHLPRPAPRQAGGRRVAQERCRAETRRAFCRPQRDDERTFRTRTLHENSRRQEMTNHSIRGKIV